MLYCKQDVEIDRYIRYTGFIKGELKMVKKLINTFKYGNRKTKQKLYLMIGILSAGVLLAVVACVLGSVLLGILAFGLIFINGLILLNTSFEQRTVTAEHAKQRKKGGKKQTDEEEPGALEWLSSEKKEEEKEYV